VQALFFSDEISVITNGRYVDCVWLDPQTSSLKIGETELTDNRKSLVELPQDETVVVTIRTPQQTQDVVTRVQQLEESLKRTHDAIAQSNTIEEIREKIRPKRAKTEGGIEAPSSEGPSTTTTTATTTEVLNALAQEIAPTAAIVLAPPKKRLSELQQTILNAIPVGDTNALPILTIKGTAGVIVDIAEHINTLVAEGYARRSRKSNKSSPWLVWKDQ